jgi:hypothetical protein
MAMMAGFAEDCAAVGFCTHETISYIKNHGIYAWVQSSQYFPPLLPIPR